MHTPFPTGTPWLVRALLVSAVVHALGVLVVHVTLGRGEDHHEQIVDIEIAPAPPKAEALPAERAVKREHPQGAEPAAAAQEPAEPPEKVLGSADAGVQDSPVDAAIDAPVDAAKKHKPDAAVDAAVDAPGDAEIAETVVAVGSAGSGDAGATESGSGSGSQDRAGMPATVAMGSGSGSAGMTDEPAVAGEPTSAGTAANLLAYFPPGHVVSALIRFDRLRGSEWAAQTERLLEPLPDYRGLFGNKHGVVADKIDTLVISSPRPRDVTATTLVAHSALTRKQVRELLGDATPITWSTARGGMLGKRKPKDVPNDRRMVLSPWKGWFVLAQPEDLGALAGAARGNLETLEARGALPPWLDTIRTIEKESGEEPGKGPALVVTLAGDGKRIALPDVGLGLTALPGPERVSIAVELDPKGWRVRGNIKLASEADAAELVRALQQAQQRVKDSRVLSAVLRTQHVYNAITGLSLARSGDRVSYATSVSIADARAVLAAAAASLDQYFGRTP